MQSLDVVDRAGCGVDEARRQAVDPCGRLYALCQLGLLGLERPSTDGILGTSTFLRIETSFYAQNHIFGRGADCDISDSVNGSLS